MVHELYRQTDDRRQTDARRHREHERSLNR